MADILQPQDDDDPTLPRVSTAFPPTDQEYEAEIRNAEVAKRLKIDPCYLRMMLRRINNAAPGKR